MRKYLAKTGKVPHTEPEDQEVLAGARQSLPNQRSYTSNKYIYIHGAPRLYETANVGRKQHPARLTGLSA